MKSGSKKSSTPPLSKMKERRLARQREQRRKQLIRISSIVGAVVGVGLLVFFIISNNQSNSGIEGLQTFPNVRGGHTTESVTYPEVPPVGGIHNPAWQNCGVYSEPVANENAVHSLEHGAIWITYRPDLPTAEVDKLQALTRQSGYRLLSPYPDLPSPIVVSAWGYQLQLEQADDSRLTQFIRSF